FLLFAACTRRPVSIPPFPYTTLFRSRDVDLDGLLADILGHGEGDRRTNVIGDLLQRRRVLGDDRHVDRDLRLADLDADALGEVRSEEHTSELQSRFDLVCRLLLEKKK